MKIQCRHTRRVSIIHRQNNKQYCRYCGATKGMFKPLKEWILAGIFLTMPEQQNTKNQW